MDIADTLLICVKNHISSRFTILKNTKGFGSSKSLKHLGIIVLFVTEKITFTQHIC